MKYLYFFLITSCMSSLTCAYKILGVFPVGAKSHYIIGNSLMKGLAEKGHEVTVISPYKESTPIPNYRTIQVIDVYESIEGMTHMTYQYLITTFIICFQLLIGSYLK